MLSTWCLQSSSSTWELWEMQSLRIYSRPTAIAICVSLMILEKTKLWELLQRRLISWKQIDSRTFMQVVYWGSVQKWKPVENEGKHLGKDVLSVQVQQQSDPTGKSAVSVNSKLIFLNYFPLLHWRCDLQLFMNKTDIAGPRQFSEWCC